MIFFLYGIPGGTKAAFSGSSRRGLGLALLGYGMLH